MTPASPDPQRPDRRAILGTLASLVHFGFVYSGRPAAAQAGNGSSTPPPNSDSASNQPTGPECGQPGTGGWVTLDKNCGTGSGSISQDRACGKPVQAGFPQVTDDKDCGLGTGKGLSEDSACGKLYSASPPTFWRDLTCGQVGGTTPDKDCGLPSGPKTGHLDNDCFLTYSDQDCGVVGADLGAR